MWVKKCRRFPLNQLLPIVVFHVQLSHRVTYVEPARDSLRNIILDNDSCLSERSLIDLDRFGLDLFATLARMKGL